MLLLFLLLLMLRKQVSQMGLDKYDLVYDLHLH